MFEVIREEMPKFKSAHDVAVMVFSSEVISLPHPELKETLHGLFAQAGLYK